MISQLFNVNCECTDTGTHNRMQVIVAGHDRIIESQKIVNACIVFLLTVSTTVLDV